MSSRVNGLTMVPLVIEQLKTETRFGKQLIYVLDLIRLRPDMSRWEISIACRINVEVIGLIVRELEKRKFINRVEPWSPV